MLKIAKSLLNQNLITTMYTAVRTPFYKHSLQITIPNHKTNDIKNIVNQYVFTIKVSMKILQ